MTIDDLAEKIEHRFDVVDDKLDSISLTVAKHTVTLNSHDKEILEIKEDKSKLEDRIAKLERWMWISIGAGGAAGAGLAKLFM